MKRTFILMGLGTLIAVAAISFPNAVLAYKGDPSVKGPNYSEERHEAMQKAFENKDYNAWKALMAGRGRVSKVITQENFAKFAEAHILALQGKPEEARKIRTELGLGLQNGSGMGQGMGYGRSGR